MQDLYKFPARITSLAAIAIAMLLAGGCSGGTVTIGNDSQRPFVSISGIDQGELIFNDRRVSVFASDPDGSITRLRVWIDGELVFADSYFNHQVVEEFDLFGDRSASGWHSIEAIATDDDGNTDRELVDYQVAF